MGNLLKKIKKHTSTKWQKNKNTNQTLNSQSKLLSEEKNSILQRSKCQDSWELERNSDQDNVLKELTFLDPTTTLLLPSLPSKLLTSSPGRERLSRSTGTALTKCSHGQELTDQIFWSIMEVMPLS